MRAISGTVFCVLVALLIGCGSVDPDPGSPPATLEVLVTVDGVGLPNAFIELTVGTATTAGTTDEGGRVTFQGLTSDPYTVRLLTVVPGVDFGLTTRMGELDAGATKSLEFAGLTALGRIEGRVTVDGAGRSGVFIEITGPVTSSTVTLFDGGYGWDGLLTGNYTVAIVEPPANVTFDRTFAVVLVDSGATVVVDFMGVTNTTPSGIAVPDSGAPIGESRLTGVTAYPDATSIRFDITTQWTAPGPGEEVQLSVGGQARSPTGTEVIADIGVDNLGNLGATIFNRADFSVVASQTTTGDSLASPATVTAPITTSDSATELVVTVEGVAYSLYSMDVSVLTRDDAGQPLFTGILPVDLPAFIAAIKDG